MPLRVLPLLSVVALWLTPSSQAALFVASPPASSAPSTPENAYPAFLPNESESQIGLLVANDPLDKTDPMGLEPIQMSPEEDMALRGAARLTTQLTQEAKDGFERVLSVYRLNGEIHTTNRKNATVAVGKAFSGPQNGVAPPVPKDAVKIGDAHDHTNNSNLSRADANSGNQDRVVKYVDTGRGIQRWRPDADTTKSSKNMGGVREVLTGKNWIQLPPPPPEIPHSILPKIH